jgi:hypothetical protein
MRSQDESPVSINDRLDAHGDQMAPGGTHAMPPSATRTVPDVVRQEPSTPGLHAAGDLARRVAGGLGAAGADPLTKVLAQRVRDPACYEVSVRGRPGRAPSAGRMMIERAAPEVLDAIARALDVALPPGAPRWIELANQEALPLIAGWDVRGGGNQRCVKLYVNASDASRAARARLCAALVPRAAGATEPPAVVGMNARADGGAETKLYVQSADAVALANGLGPHAVALARAARDEGADAGGVLSFDVTRGPLRPRAFFVALREPTGGATWRSVRSLPGYDEGVIESLLPFAPAPPRAAGISLDGTTWTVYFKPGHSGRAPEALEPTAIFRLDGAEVGVFVEPTEHAARAFRRTERHAVSVRVRHGMPSPQALEALVDWFTARLRTAESNGRPVGAYVTAPPAPWRTIDVVRSDDGMDRS